jgi:hypothetical protein
MAPKRIQVQAAGSKSRSAASGSYARTVYREITASENRSVLQSVIFFGVCAYLTWKNNTDKNLRHQAAVAFFSSSWSEFIIPQ